MHLASKLALVVVLLGFAPASGSTALIGPQPAPNVTNLSFTILRDGTPFGTHRTIIRRDGGGLVVETAITAKLDLAFLSLYRFRHESREEWRDGRLVSLEAFTDDDGQTSRVSALATPEGLEVNGPNGRFIAPAETVPTTFWHAAFLKAPSLLDVQEGRLVKVAVRSGGADIVAAAHPGPQRRHFSLSGDLDMDLWFDADGSLAECRFFARGYTITYARDRSGLADAR